MKLFTPVIIISLLNCTLLEPSYLLIQNESEYPIAVSIKNANVTNLYLDKGDGDYVLSYSDRINFRITVDYIGFNRDYSVRLKYMQKKKFIFKVE